MWILDYGDRPKVNLPSFVGDDDNGKIVVAKNDADYRVEVKSPVIDRWARLGWQLYRDKSEKS